MTDSTGTKTLENIKLESYRSDINQICPVCAPKPLSFTENALCQSKDGRG